LREIARGGGGGGGGGYKDLRLSPLAIQSTKNPNPIARAAKKTLP